AQLWDLKPLKPVRSFSSGVGGVGAAAFSPDGQTLVLGTTSEGVVLWSPETDARRTLAHRGPILGVQFAADVPLGASVGARSVKLWDWPDCRELAELAGHQATIVAASFGPEGRLLLTGSFDHTAILWETATGRQLAAYDWQIGKVHAVALAPDGMTAAVG